MGSTFVTRAGRTGDDGCVSYFEVKLFLFRMSEEMGGLVNYFTLWSNLPSEDWPGLQVRSNLKSKIETRAWLLILFFFQVTTKLDFPFKVQIRGSWGEEVRIQNAGNHGHTACSA